ncbi:sensor histidine kinase [Chitinophaga pinensis]|uniref:histidine kinase n=1 Tax=Chitinophaga pinensis (strain ATCC 43595 / DSM 2588 / LMG 13176 / NBRC 15968 / NCIMB 11800 / UQM 2034) TaxID=485918 RepID=A0A979GQK8_CHIPD|nr:HAMP domain-containing sensor histidine kinase [Chitinophaga pinensis]ACU57756.1 histidine kinase [Chitinophaga pinensis DSM 2588]
MKRRLRFTRLVAICTVSLIILFQIYWVYNNFKVSQHNFITSARYALQKSISAYQLRQSELPTSLKYKDPTLTFFLRTIPNRDSIAFDTPAVIKPFHAEFLTVKIDEYNISEVNAIMGRLISQQFRRPINLDSLGVLYKQELSRENIAVSFKLMLLDSTTVLSQDEISVPIKFHRSPVVIVKAIPEHLSAMLWKQNILPAVISLVLILLSAGSLFFMGSMMLRQMRLNNFKDDFINNITHELRTPLTILKSSIDALKSFGASSDPDRLERYLSINLNIIKKLDKDIDRILEISKYEHGILYTQLTTVNLRELAVEVAGRFDLHAPDTIVIFNPLHNDVVSTDRFIIDTILSNLIDNAIKYSQGNVCINISFPPIANGWKLQIQDNGKGIDPFHLPFIFDKFYRVHSQNVHEVKGYGLGLSYVKLLVTALNGQIFVTSQINKGTIFTIQFHNE